MRTPPPSVIDSWPEPNYVNPETRGPRLLITQLIFVPLALLVLLARLYVRIFVVRRAGWDDWMMAMAMVFSTGVSIAAILMTELYGWNVHIWDQTPEQTVRGRQTSMAGQTLYLFATGLVKLSILVSYLRIALLGSWFRRLTLATIPFVVALKTAFLIVQWTQCVPIKEYWNANKKYSCINEAPLITISVLSTVTDFVVYTLPLPTLARLHLPLVQRCLLVFVFSMGLVVVAAGCLRTYWATRVMFTYDVTWNGFNVWTWTAVEVNLGVVCGCAPLLRPLVRGVVSRRKGNRQLPDREGAKAIGSSPNSDPEMGRGGCRASWLEKLCISRIGNRTSSSNNTTPAKSEGSDTIPDRVQGPRDSGYWETVDLEDGDRGGEL